MKLSPKDGSPIPAELPFDDWARAKYREVSKSVNPCDENGKLDPQRLNEVLTVFSQHFAWAITVQEVESNKLNRLNHEWDNWQKARYNNAYRAIREESGGTGRPPGQVTIEARIVDMFADEIEVKQRALEEQKSRVDLLKGFVRVLDKQASILQTLSSNMRSELFFAGGVSLGEGKMTDGQINRKTKALLHTAMHGQETEGSE